MATWSLRWGKIGARFKALANCASVPSALRRKAVGGESRRKAASTRGGRWMLKVALAGWVVAAHADVVVVDFEQAEVGRRLAEWVEKDVVFKLARSPAQTKAVGRMVFFPHLGSGRKGILNAMAMEPIPVEVRFPKVVSSVTLVLWGSTGCAAQVEAFDAKGEIVDRASMPVIPRRAAPGDPVPLFELTVRAPEIAFVRFSGPREGEFLAADEVRFTPAAKTTE